MTEACQQTLQYQCMAARWQFRACKYHRRASCRAHNDARLVQLFSCGAIVPTNEEELMLLQPDVNGFSVTLNFQPCR